jgi:hypothetical protein
MTMKKGQRRVGYVTDKGKPPRREESERVFTCNKGDEVLFQGKRVVVAQIIELGFEPKTLKNKHGKYTVQGEKDVVTVCHYDRTGLLLTRSPQYAGTDWEHIKKPEVRTRANNEVKHEK